MTPRQYTIVLAVSSAIAWAGWLLMLLLVDPAEVGAVGVAVFLFALWLALVGSTSLAGLRLQFTRDPDVVTSRAAAAAFRSGLIIATALIAVLVAARAL